MVLNSVMTNYYPIQNNAGFVGGPMVAIWLILDSSYSWLVLMTGI